MTSNDTTSARTDDDAAVRGVLGRVYDAWAVGNADAFVADYAQEATAVLPGSYLPSRDVIHATMVDAFAGPLKGSRAVHEVQSIRFLGAGAVVVITKGAVVPAGQANPSEETRSVDTWVLSRPDGSWRVAAFQNSPERMA